MWVLVTNLKLFLKLSKMDPNRYKESQNDRAINMKLKLFLMSLWFKISIKNTLQSIPAIIKKIEFTPWNATLKSLFTAKNWLNKNSFYIKIGTCTVDLVEVFCVSYYENPKKLLYELHIGYCRSGYFLLLTWR